MASASHPMAGGGDEVELAKAARARSASGDTGKRSMVTTV